MLVLSGLWRSCRDVVRISTVAIAVMAFGLLAFTQPTSADAPIVATVVVYPLTSSGGLATADVGGKFSTAIAVRLSQAGSLLVKPFTPGTDRTGYLIAARAVGADYYVSGFMTAIGAEVTLVLQVVSTTSGTVAWSQSALVHTFADADAEADAIRHAILAREGRYVAELSAPTPSGSEPRPSERPNEADISLSGRRGRGRPGVLASPAATATVTITVATASTAPVPEASGTPLEVVTAVPAATPLPTVDRPVSTPGVTAVPAGQRPAPTSPPSFGRGSAFATYRSSVGTTSRTLATRFTPHGVALTSLTMSGAATAPERLIAIAALTSALHAHPQTNASWIVGSDPLSLVRQHAERFCLSHAGIGALYVADFEVTPAQPEAPAEVDVAITRSDCLGVVEASAAASRAFNGTSADDALVRAFREAIGRLGKPRA